MPHYKSLAKELPTHKKGIAKEYVTQKCLAKEGPAQKKHVCQRMCRNNSLDRECATPQKIGQRMCHTKKVLPKNVPHQKSLVNECVTEETS